MRLIAEPVEIRSTFTGDLKAMSARLNTAEAEQAIVITVNHASAETLAALGESLEAAARFITNTTSKDHQLTVEQMVSLLMPQKDDWGLAYWFISMNSYLGGERPQDLLIAVPARVVAAAEYEVAGVTHG